MARFRIFNIIIFGIFLSNSPITEGEGRNDSTNSDAVISRSGFISNSGEAKPVRGSIYNNLIPEIYLNEPSSAIVIIYSHGTENPRVRENCGAWWNDVPHSLLSLATDKNTYIYYLCSTKTDPIGRDHGSWIFKRVNEISEVLDDLNNLGVLPKNIFLSGHSAGGWSSLMAMSFQPEKFNSAIVFAPAFAGPRSEINTYPIWRSDIRPKHIDRLISYNSINALIFAYDNDSFNRKTELDFLPKRFPNSITLISYWCAVQFPGNGHLTHLKDCKQKDTESTIRSYIYNQISNHSFSKQ